MPAKFERCVQDIKDAGQADGVNPWAVCHASTGEIKPEEPDKLLSELDDMISKDASFPSADASYKHSGNMVPTESDHSYENTLPEEMLKEIDDMISKDASFPSADASYKFTGSMVTQKKPDTYGNTASEMGIKEQIINNKINNLGKDNRVHVPQDETVSIPGSLSAVKIKGKKREGNSMMQETVYKSILDYKLSHPCQCKNKK